MSTKVLLRVLCAAVLLSVSAFAVDGVVLINQNTVMAAGGFPYKITQPGSYRLTSNLLVSAGVDGIDINAEDVTLDLNGFSIMPVGCTQDRHLYCNPNSNPGIVSSHDRITIRNGSVLSMSTGIRLFSMDALVEEVHVWANTGDGIGVASGIVRRCTASQNGGSGITNIGFGLGGLIVTENVTDLNSHDGISIFEGAATGNKISQNAVGLFAQHSIVGSNLLFSNGISLQDGTVSQNNNNCDGSSC